MSHHNPLAKSYPLLTAKERFQLILAAGARGDHAEQDRIRNAGQRITLSMSDHAPWGRAFEEIATTVFMEFVDAAATHRSTLMLWCEEEDEREMLEEDDEDEADDEVAEGEIADADVAEDESTSDEEGLAGKLRMQDLYLAEGFTLKTRIPGWRLFCERWKVQPFALWELLPGYKRLKVAIDLLEGNRGCHPPAFVPEGMVAWLTEIRDPDTPVPTVESLLSPESFADSLDEFFRHRVTYWGG